MTFLYMRFSGVKKKLLLINIPRNYYTTEKQLFSRKGLIRVQPQ